jgi:glycerol-3-phosphate dehydrogenase
MPESDAARAARERYDLIVVGGGILGCLVALESALRGLRPLLVERDEFGGATSANSLRILHGGLRYLQSLDLVRFFESVRERRWFLAEFPDLAEPLPCVMPLYGRGLKRTSVLKLALLANDALSYGRNDGVREDRRLPAGRILSRAEVLDAAPFVPSDGLTGGALWYDARMLDPKAIVADVLGRMMRAGATALAGVEVDGLMIEGNRCAGVNALDRQAGDRLTFAAPIVVNAAGPWAPLLLQSFAARPQIELEFAIAWNLLVDRPMPGASAVALTAPEPGAQTFFAYPSGNELLVGTGHAAWNGDRAKLAPAEAELERFLAAVNRAAPALALSMRDVRRTLAGLLPTTARGSAELTQRPTVVDHGARGGVAGLYTVVGIKYTTARATARKLLATMGLAARRA